MHFGRQSGGLQVRPTVSVNCLETALKAVGSFFLVSVKESTACQGRLMSPLFQCFSLLCCMIHEVI